MKRKIIALFIMIFLIVSSITTVSAESSLNTLLEKILTIDAAERDSYITLLVPMFMVDSGIEDLQGFVRDYQPDNENSYMNVYIGKLLKYTDKQTLINALETIKCTEIQARRNFLDALKNKTSVEISSATEQAIETLLNKSYNSLPALKKLLEEGNYETDSIAKLIISMVEINGSNELYVYDGKNFSAGKIDAELRKKVNKVWADYVITENGLEKKSDGADGEEFDLSAMLEASAKKLNSHIPSSEREAFAKALSKIDVIKISSSGNNTPSGGNQSGSSSNNNNSEVPPVVQPSNDETIEISVNEGQIKTVTLDTNAKNPVLYKKNGNDLDLVKYSALSDGKLIAKISQSGTYVIKDSSYIFNDCEGWAKDYIEMLASRGIINGKASGIYAPNDTITREEFVKLIIELLGIEKSEAQVIFEDVNPDAWYAGYVAVAYENKIISGMSATQFGVGAPIRRQDMAKIINTVLSQKGIKGNFADENVFGDFDTIADYAKEHVLSIYSMGIISGDTNGNFNPQNYATRAEAAKMVYGMLVQIINN